MSNKATQVTNEHPNPKAKFLIVRRDNIGDLICTTPMIASLRTHFPQARIDILVNSYCLPVLDNNPDIDHAYSYTKLHHRKSDETALGVIYRRLKEILKLRSTRYDYVILAKNGCLPRQNRWARLVKARHAVGYYNSRVKGSSAIDLRLSEQSAKGLHIVAALNRLLTVFGIESPPSKLRLFPLASEAEEARKRLYSLQKESGPIIGVHISARKVKQRWPVSHFIEFIAAAHQRYHASIVLFWSPGDENNPLHPGDDDKAAEIMAALPGVPVLAYPTRNLSDLIAGLTVCDRVVCSDGGAMHVAAALGKPIVCFFGNSDANVWHPWGVPYELLQPPSRNVQDITVDDVLEAFERLNTKAPRNSEPVNEYTSNRSV